MTHVTDALGSEKLNRERVELRIKEGVMVEFRYLICERILMQRMTTKRIERTAEFHFTKINTWHKYTSSDGFLGNP